MAAFRCQVPHCNWLWWSLWRQCALFCKVFVQFVLLTGIRFGVAHTHTPPRVSPRCQASAIATCLSALRPSTSAELQCYLTQPLALYTFLLLIYLKLFHYLLILWANSKFNTSHSFIYCVFLCFVCSIDQITIDEWFICCK